MIIVFDLDGTLSIVGDRIKYLRQEKPDWDSFYNHCGEDKVNNSIAKLYNTLCAHYNDCDEYIIYAPNNKTIDRKRSVFIVTGRRESCRLMTIDWFNKNGMFIDENNLLMRADNDYRHDTIVKPELVKDFVNDIDIVFEDRNSMVKKWRELGVACLQVANGDF